MDRAGSLVLVLQGPPSPPGDRGLIASLMGLGSPEEVGLEVRRLAASHESPHVRAHARRILTSLPALQRPPRLPADAGPEDLRRALEVEDPFLHREVGERASRLDPGSARMLALTAVRSPGMEGWILTGWVALLGQFGAAEDADELTALLDHACPAVQAAALEALVRVAPETGTYAAVNRREAPDPVVRGAALRIMARTDPDRAAKGLLYTAASEDWWMRSAVFPLLDLVPDPVAEEVCVELLLRENDGLNAARALARLGQKGERRGAGAVLAWQSAEAQAVASAARGAWDALRARLQLGAAELEQELKDFRGARLRTLAAGLSSPPPKPAEPEEEESLADRLEVEDPDADETPIERRAAEQALARLAEGEPDVAFTVLQDQLDAGQIRLTSPVRMALGLACLWRGDPGAALGHLRAVDPVRLAAPHLYVLARELEAAGAPGEARRFFDAVEREVPGYRDVETRVHRLPEHSGLPEIAWKELESRFDNLVPLGEGGMGRVYKGHDRRRDRPVAIKVPAEELIEDPRGRERFLLEMEALAALDHPGVVRVMEVSAGDLPFYSMELVKGGTLTELLQVEGPLSPDRALELFRPLASALAHIHGVGIVHRDLKPDNVMVDDRGQPVLTDFGLAYEELRAAANEKGKAVGTLAYMAPEQLRGEAPSAAADVYSFGVLLFEALSGELPFRLTESIRKCQDEAPRLLDRGVETPPLLEDLVSRCLELFPWDRPEDGKALAEQLRDLD